MEHDKIWEFAIRFRQREKTSIRADDLRAIDANEIKLWALYTGMGSDHAIFIIKKDGGVFVYDHNTLYGYAARRDEFCLLHKFLLKHGALWKRIRCAYNNVLYVRPEDQAWLESVCKDLCLPSMAHPYACMECVCQSLLKQVATPTG